MTPDNTAPSEPFLRDSKEGMTIKNAEVLLPDLIHLLSPQYVAELEKSELGPKLERIDGILRITKLSPALEKTAMKARIEVLKKIHDLIDAERI